MSSKLKVLQVIPKLGYGGAETGCYDLAHYLPENNCSSFIVTSGGELVKFIDQKKVKLIKLPVHSKNPILIFFNSIALIFIILFHNISIVHAQEAEHLLGPACLQQKLQEENLLQLFMALIILKIQLKSYIIL